jgi:hypothetical protein
MAQTGFSWKCHIQSAICNGQLEVSTSQDPVPLPNTKHGIVIKDLEMVLVCGHQFFSESERLP